MSGSRWLLDIQVEMPSRQTVGHCVWRSGSSLGVGQARKRERERGRTFKDVSTEGPACLPGTGQSLGLASGSLEVLEEEEMTGEQRGPPPQRRAGGPHPAGCGSQFRARPPVSVSEAQLHSAAVPPAARGTAASLESVLHKSSAGTVEILTCVRYQGSFSSFE